jgi:hypothetical protein
MTLRSASGRVERQSALGISPKTETRCHNFSFLGHQDFQKRDFRKTINFGSAF